MSQKKKKITPPADKEAFRLMQRIYADLLSFVENYALDTDDTGEEIADRIERESKWKLTPKTKILIPGAVRVIRQNRDIVERNAKVEKYLKSLPRWEL